MRLKVAAKVYPEEEGYFRQVIQPLLRESQPWVEFIGEVGGRQKDEFLGNAAALLFPIDWPEPFGLVMIESLACGTPVIAWPNGSVPEIIQDGVTGFLVECEEEALEVLGHIPRLKRGRCRQAFEQRFDVGRMAQDYFEVYSRLIDLDPDPIAKLRRTLPLLSGSRVKAQAAARQRAPADRANVAGRISPPAARHPK